MSTKQAKRDLALTSISAHILKTGLAQTGVRQLAKAAGISDRMLLYYFKDKEDVMTAVFAAIADSLTGHLGSAVPEGTRMDPVAFMSTAATVTQSPNMRPHMKLWIEVVAAAARQEAPYTTVANTIVSGFLAWIENHLDIEDPVQRADAAAMVLAYIDGLAILDVCTDRSTTQRAITALAALRG